mmetsp:Transcript_23568/g.35403  ORF Transcript_23568/g.35403 Transcript_23568/m.35403 type:complete len:84 (+) Transcript_23568:191-442(+)
MRQKIVYLNFSSLGAFQPATAMKDKLQFSGMHCGMRRIGSPLAVTLYAVSVFLALHMLLHESFRRFALYVRLALLIEKTFCRL